MRPRAASTLARAVSRVNGGLSDFVACMINSFVSFPLLLPGDRLILFYLSGGAMYYPILNPIQDELN